MITVITIIVSRHIRDTSEHKIKSDLPVQAWLFPPAFEEDLLVKGELGHLLRLAESCLECLHATCVSMLRAPISADLANPQYTASPVCMGNAAIKKSFQ